tara:strand:- start:39299 stop:40969 length:1671 start_codon:yes stop_codon:yes gene_type:complete
MTAVAIANPAAPTPNERLKLFAEAMRRTRKGADIVRVAERFAPGIVGNPFCPHFPHPRQLAGLFLPEWHNDKLGPFEMLFGGAAGGGKSDWLLMLAAMRAFKHGHYRCVILRRTHQEMLKAGAILSRAMQWWLPMGVHWDGTNKKFRFPSGAEVEFGYHASRKDDAQFQGTEYHDALFDELTHWPDDAAFDWLKTRLRTNSNDPLVRRLLATSNPGGEGHTWVKERFIGGTDIVTGKSFGAKSFYLPSKITDNPSLDREAYIATLEDLHPTRRAQLLDGDWGAREPGDYFRQEWFGPLLTSSPTDGIAIRWWDLAASEGQHAARTAGVRVIRLRKGARVITHATAFRATPGKRDAKILQQAQLDGHGTTVGVEIEPGSGGIAQFDAISKLLRQEGFKVVGARPRAHGPELTENEKAALAMNTPSDKGKEGRAAPVASCLERGYQRRGETDNVHESPYWGLDAGLAIEEQRDGLRLVAGPWTQGFLDEVEGFPGAKLKDLVDALSGAWGWLQAHPFGLSAAPQNAIALPAVTHNTHPDDRGEDERDESQKRQGRWRQ